VGRTGKTEPVSVCLDADVLIAGLLSRTGASHAILILGEIGLLTLVLPEAVIEEVRRNLSAKLSEALPLFQEFLRSVPARVYRPTAQDRERARALADPKDVPILASAIGNCAISSSRLKVKCWATSPRRPDSVPIRSAAWRGMVT
jgi:predicted nucleic acid-binding protein